MPRPKGATNIEWVETKLAAEKLGITPRQLRKLRTGMKIGVHYRVISPRAAARPTYQWNLAKCREYLEVPLEQR
jgi:hypothetical protein